MTGPTVRARGSAVRAAAWALAAAALLGPAASPARGGEAAGMGFAGFMAMQRLDLAPLNARLGALPPLPAQAWAAGYGVLAVGPSGWGFAVAGETYRWESRGPSGMSRLVLAHTQVGVVRRWGGGGRAPALLAGLMGGLATAELELAEGAPARFDEFTMNRFTRHLVSLQPEVGLLWRVSPSARLHVAVGYLAAGDFWNRGWRHPYGSSLEGVPAWLSGPSVRVALLVGGP